MLVKNHMYSSNSITNSSYRNEREREEKNNEEEEIARLMRTIAIRVGQLIYRNERIIFI